MNKGAVYETVSKDDNQFVLKNPVYPTISQSTNNYIRLSDGGNWTYIQWGSTTVRLGQYSPVITFPTAFYSLPYVFLQDVGTYNSSGSGNYPPPRVMTISKSSMRVGLFRTGTQESTTGIFWLAIG